MNTLELQKSLNVILRATGYIPLDEDSNLGKKTCGAARAYLPDQVPATCASIGFTAPAKLGSQTTTVSVAKASATPLPTTNMSLLSSTKWIIGSSIAIALGLVGWAVAQKKGWIG